MASETHGHGLRANAAGASQTSGAKAAPQVRGSVTGRLDVPRRTSAPGNGRRCSGADPSPPRVRNEPIPSGLVQGVLVSPRVLSARPGTDTGGNACEVRERGAARRGDAHVVLT